ncbi:hypothetical protein F2Q68_00044420 [Brassica cretica]|uniref:Uncharacterized protein n=1 Tax=Brassica cretica TaxID=69181 RepID=A0A8S9LLD7_BRACR|nr:hypothetical protein F2Q68_00044420 [Brassica cretica]
MTTTNLTWMTVMDGDNLDEEWKAMVEEAMSVMTMRWKKMKLSLFFLVVVDSVVVP